MTQPEKCCCGEVDLQGDKWKVVGGVCHKSYAPCYHHSEPAPQQSSGIEEVVDRIKWYSNAIRGADKTPKYEYSGKGRDLNNRGEAAGDESRWSMPWELAQDMEKELSTTLTSFESRIRAEEREKAAMGQIEIYAKRESLALKVGANQERLRIADLIEGAKGYDKCLTHSDYGQHPALAVCSECKARKAHNTALQTILNLIRENKENV